MNLLQQIVRERLADVAAATVPLSELKAMASGRLHHSLIEAIRTNAGISIIAETKKASPSADVIAPDYHPHRIASIYAANGATGVSVLTEPHYFQGEAAHLQAVRAAVNLPVLRKDFIADPYQIAEAAAWGADVVLLIVAALTMDQLRRLYEISGEFGLEVLAEAHTAAEVEAALRLETAMIGVNSRDLKTFKTDLQVAIDLAAMIPDDRISIAESGIRNAADIRTLSAVGYGGFLIGESLMRASDPGAVLRELIKEF